MATDFKLGTLTFTRGVNDLVADSSPFAIFVVRSLGRHRWNDWGDVCQVDKNQNDLAAVEGTSILSAYETQGLPKIWIITEADRSSTTVLFPDEY